MCSCNHYYIGKAISITYCVALVNQHAKSMHHITHILPFLACLALPYFSTLSHKWHDFNKKVTEHKMCVLIFSTTFVWNIFNSMTNWVRYHNVHRSSCKVPIILVRFSWNLNSIDSFSKNTVVSNFIKMCPVEAKLFHVNGWMDRQTDMTKLTAAFRNFVNAPENLWQLPPCSRICYLKFNDSFENHTFVK